MKNKALLKEVFTTGTELYTSRGFVGGLVKNPIKFANSDELRKIQNRNRKRK